MVHSLMYNKKIALFDLILRRSAFRTIINTHDPGPHFQEKVRPKDLKNEMTRKSDLGKT
jgi:hypothetical protein